MALAQRSTSTTLYNEISNLVGKLLEGRPNEQLNARQVHVIVNGLHPGRYTEGQVRRGLRWQSEINGNVIKTKTVASPSKLRLYWYEPTN